MKHFYKAIILTLAVAFFGTASGQNYHPGDTMVLYNIKMNNFTSVSGGDSTELNWDDPDPGNWLGVEWNNSNPKRVIGLNLSNTGANDGPNTSQWRDDHIDMDYNRFYMDPVGVPTDLTGSINFQGLSEVEYIMLKRNDNVTRAYVYGLNKLRNINITETNIDWFYVDNLQSLIEARANKCDRLSWFYARNCPNLEFISAKYTDNRIRGIYVTNDPKLEKINVNEGNVSNLDLSGAVNLVRLNVKENNLSDDNLLNLDDCENLRSLCLSDNNFTEFTIPNTNPGMYRFGFRTNGAFAVNNTKHQTSLWKLGIEENQISGFVDCQGNTSLERFDFKENLISRVNVVGLGSLLQIDGRDNMLSELNLSGVDMLESIYVQNNRLRDIKGINEIPSLNRLRVDNNKLPITLTAQIANNPYMGSPTTWGYNFTNQLSYFPIDLVAGDSVDYSAEDTVDVFGTDEATTFMLFESNGTGVDTNMTGIFHFTIADTGKCFYIEMTCAGGEVTTENICVVAGPIIKVTIDNNDFGMVQVGESGTATVKVQNLGSSDLTVSNINTYPDFAIDATTGTISAGGSKDYVLTFSPTQAKAYTAYVEVNSNSVAQATEANEVKVFGVGVMLAGVDPAQEKLVKFYPNPTTNLLYVKDLTGEFNSFQVYNAQGTLIKVFDASPAADTSIDFTEFDAGVYFIKSVDGKINQRVIKQ